MKNWSLEDNVNDWVKSEFARIKQTKYAVKSAMYAFLKEAIMSKKITEAIAIGSSGDNTNNFTL